MSKRKNFSSEEADLITECQSLLPILRKSYGQQNIYSWSDRTPKRLAEKMQQFGIQSVGQSDTRGNWFITYNKDESSKRAKKMLESCDKDDSSDLI